MVPTFLASTSSFTGMAVCLCTFTFNLSEFCILIVRDLPVGTMSKQHCADVDVTSSRHTAINTVSLQLHVPAGLLLLVQPGVQLETEVVQPHLELVSDIWAINLSAPVGKWVNLQGEQLCYFDFCFPSP